MISKETKQRYLPGINPRPTSRALTQSWHGSDLWYPIHFAKNAQWMGHGAFVGGRDVKARSRSFDSRPLRQAQGWSLGMTSKNKSKSRFFNSLRSFRMTARI